MKSKKELLLMLFSKLAELQHGAVKIEKPALAERLKIELALLYDILGDDVSEEFCEQIEKEI